MAAESQKQTENKVARSPMDDKEALEGTSCNYIHLTLLIFNVIA